MAIVALFKERLLLNIFGPSYILDGRDLRALPLIERKMRLKAIMPKVESRVRYVDHIVGGGKKFFWLACEHDVEGIVGKWKFGTYRTDGAQTSWIKVKNLTYSQAEGRRELFEGRNGGIRRQRIKRHTPCMGCSML